MRLGTALDRLLHPGYSTCANCGYTWATVEPHVTHYSTAGFFFLCEGCWPQVHVEQRVWLAEQTMRRFNYPEDDIATIRIAVAKDSMT